MKNYDQRLTTHSFIRGFTLLELMVVLILIAALTMVAIPTIRALTDVNLKSEITKLSGLSMETYGRASISGKTHRVVFDLDNNKYWVEEKTDGVFEISPELGYDEQLKNLQAQRKKDREEGDELEFMPEFKPIDGPLGKEVVLEKNILIYGAWTEQMDNIARSGRVYIYYFSGGFTQVSFVSLAIKGSEDRSIMYLSLSPLTGAVTIDYNEPDTSELLDMEAGIKE